MYLNIYYLIQQLHTWLSFEINLENFNMVEMISQQY